MNILNFWKVGLIPLGFSILVSGLAQQTARTQIYIPVPVYRYYGAFAYSQSLDAGGAAWDSPSRRDAEEDALGYCRESGAKDCTVLGWFANQCGSLATASNGGYATKYGLGAPLVEQAALEACREATGLKCKAKYTICTGV